MWNLLKRIIGSGTRPVAMPSLEESRTSACYVTRLGEEVRADEAFDAWTSGELSAMLRALNVKTNLIDRHFLLMGIVGQAYKQRGNPKMRDLCIRISELHLREFGKIAPALKKDLDGVLPRVTTFQQYATVLAEDSQHEKAIQVCGAAISYGLQDGTQSGYEGRIARIKKKMERDKRTRR